MSSINCFWLPNFLHIRNKTDALTLTLRGKDCLFSTHLHSDKHQSRRRWSQINPQTHKIHFYRPPPQLRTRAHLHKYSHESASCALQRTELAGKRAREFGLSASVNNGRNQGQRKKERRSGRKRWGSRASMRNGWMKAPRSQRSRDLPGVPFKKKTDIWQTWDF